MPEDIRRRSPNRRVSVFTDNANNTNGSHPIHKVVISRAAIVAWSSVVLWGSLLWAFQVLQQEWEPVPAVARSGILEGVRPPVLSQKTVVAWQDLYPPSSDIPAEGNDENHRSFLPRTRTWPQTYESIPRKAGPKTELSHEGMKQVEIRRLPTYNEYCQPKSAWHSYSFPTCNSMHEIDVLAGIVPPSAEQQAMSSSGDTVEETTNTAKDEVFMEYKFSGASRSAWLVESVCTGGSNCVAPGLNATEEKKIGPQLILKTLNWEMDYDEVVFEHQRIDALAAERLTASPHVVDIYGACGGSALNEFADGGSFGKMVRRWNESALGTTSPEELLVYARDAALSLAATHEIDGRGNISTMVHHDYSAKNFLIVNGKLKLSDFNDGQLLRWDKKYNQRCNGFFWDGKCGSNRERTHRRAPEECMGDKYRRYTTEKVEVYHLGSLLFSLLTQGGWPYSFEVSSKGVPHKPTSTKVKKMISTGVLPALPADVEASKNNATKALIQAMKWAYTFSPKKRPSARAVGDFIDKKIKVLQPTTRTSTT